MRSAPVRVTRSALVAGLISAALFAIARTTGSGWLVVLLAGLVALLIVAVVAPAVAVRTVAVAVTTDEGWGVAGRRVPVHVEVRTRAAVRVRPVSPPGPAFAVIAASEGEVDVVPAERGIVRTVRLEVRCAAPLGIVWWRRTLEARLARPLEVGPAPMASRRPFPVAAGVVGDDAAGGRVAHDDMVRGAREYRPGDPLRLMHWPATARTGELMVKELESPAAPSLVVVVELSGDRGGAEEAASRAAGIALDALTAGLAVTLATVEEGGPVLRRVATAEDVARRLARAVPGPTPDLAPLAHAGELVRVSAAGAS